MIGQAIGRALPFAVGVALSPVPIIAVVLMLSTPNGRVGGLAFLIGWVVGIAVPGTIVLLVAGGASASKHGSPATWVSIVKIVGAPVAALVDSVSPGFQDPSNAGR
jgi:threonine/homoserine/homoserine lactone efflux protein